MLQSLFVYRRLLTGRTVIPVSLIAVVPTVLEKSVFYGYLAVASVSLGLPTQFVHCCLAATRAFMPASGRALSRRARSGRHGEALLAKQNG